MELCCPLDVACLFKIVQRDCNSLHQKEPPLASRMSFGFGARRLAITHRVSATNVYSFKYIGQLLTFMRHHASRLKSCLKLIVLSWCPDIVLTTCNIVK